MAKLPPTHRCQNVPQTRSPTLKRLTSGPTATTSPTPSESGTSGSGNIL